MVESSLRTQNRGTRAGDKRGKGGDEKSVGERGVRSGIKAVGGTNRSQSAREND